MVDHGGIADDGTHSLDGHDGTGGGHHQPGDPSWQQPDDHQAHDQGDSHDHHHHDTKAKKSNHSHEGHDADAPEGSDAEHDNHWGPGKPKGWNAEPDAPSAEDRAKERLTSLFAKAGISLDDFAAGLKKRGKFKLETFADQVDALIGKPNDRDVPLRKWDKGYEDGKDNTRREFGRDAAKETALAMSMRAFYLMRHNPTEVAFALSQIVKTPDANAKTADDAGNTSDKVAALPDNISKGGIAVLALGSFNELMKHYLGSSVMRIGLQQLNLLAVRDPNSKLGFRKRTADEKQMRIALNAVAVLDRLVNDNNNDSRDHLAEFVGISSGAMHALLGHALEWANDPKNRPAMLAMMPKKETDKTDTSEDKAEQKDQMAMVRLLSGIVSKSIRALNHLPTSRADIDRLTDVLDIIASEERLEKPLESWWTRPEERAQEETQASGRKKKKDPQDVTPETAAPAKNATIEPQERAFLARPGTQLGAAIGSAALAGWVAHATSDKARAKKEGKEPGEKPTPPSGWQRAAKFFAIAGLTVATGIFAWRAGFTPNKDGQSFVSRLLPSSGARSL